MNQIETLYQPSFNHPYAIQHKQNYVAATSPLVHQFVPPPHSPVAQHHPPSSPSPRHSIGHDFQGGHAQAKVQGPRSQVPVQNQSTPYASAAGLTQGITAPVLSPTKPISPTQHIGSASPQRYPMAAPPLPASVQRQQSPQNSSASSISQPSSPQSSASALREKERVALLLDINLELLQEMNKLQAEGKGGAPSPQQAAAMKAQGLPDQIAADEYIQVYYRVSSNISYLYNQPDMQLLNPQNQGQAPQKKGPPHPPQFMWAPPQMPSLDGKYAALRKLFPGWLGRDAPAGADAQPQQ
ncbi:hypothetical protein CAC42_8037 [Sphaceloma murrayae]|uniref:Uncharacterized protein n=1 Tax=Sphaceloma murrayae TaxID=2082308 RepID=A0A2K1QQY9_9PEZI|nr:hypothetical protein CAC42_8037 [Sphaceloma murrayae]